MDDCLIQDVHSAGTLAAAVYEYYTKWAFSNGLKPMSNSCFGKELKKKVGEPKDTNKGRLYVGVVLKPGIFD